MKIKDITTYLETIAPLDYQESYDNAGLIIGNANTECTNALLCLDSTEEVIDEAIQQGCNLVIAHHPIIFGGLKKITGKNYAERAIIKAIKNDIAIYAIHTNLDNVYAGVNQKICEKLGLQNCKILAPKNQLLRKLAVSCSMAHSDMVRNALFEAGAGDVGDYDESSFNVLGISTFVGQPNVNQGSMMVQVIYPMHLETKILAALHATHPAKRPTYDITTIQNAYEQIGSGMIGELPEDTSISEFLKNLKTSMKTDSIRYTKPTKKKVRRIAVCGGAGSFLLNNAISQKADVFITSDFKYHQFFDANDQITIADIGHYESEQFTTEILHDMLSKKFSTFAPVLATTNTNPVKYL
jgi:dinuclear metal center YbgI/SA1388 family protein